MPQTSISESETPLLAAMEANLHGHISFLERSIPGMTVLDREDLLLVDSGLPSDTFNKIARARLRESEADRRIDEAVQHFRSVACPFTWWVGPCSRPLDLEDRLGRHGLEPAESELGMSMDLRALPSAHENPAGLAVQRVTAAQQIIDFARVFAANWNPPDPAVLTFYRSATPALLVPDCPMRLFVGYLEGVPVAASELFIGGGVAGLYSVATLKEFRDRGIGSALTWAAADEPRRAAISTAVIQSSDAGKGLYTRLGFCPCCHFTEYA